MATEKKWYALYTRAKWEKKVVALLDKKTLLTIVHSIGFINNGRTVKK